MLIGIQSTGVAWLSQVRVVRCLVKSFNERNPQRMLLLKAFLFLGTATKSMIWLECPKIPPFYKHPQLPLIYWREVRITSSHHDPYEEGYTRVTMAMTKGCNDASRSESSNVVSVQIALCNPRA